MLLTYHLDGALQDLRDIIAITKEDIEDIKQANAEEQFARLPLKEEKIASFEAKKAMIDFIMIFLKRLSQQRWKGMTK